MERSFGQWIKQCRKALSLTQEELAEEIGYAISTVRKIESGVLRPSREIAVTLARTLQIPEGEQDEFVRLARAPQNPAGSAQRVPAAGSPAAPAQLAPAAAPGLPVPPTALIGRTEEMAAISGLLEGGVRLLNLIGPPGIGKTRLALEVALQMQPAYGGRVFWVALNALNDAPYVPQALAQALGVQLRPGENPAESIQAALADAPALVVFDNFEHVLPAAPLLADLLAHCPRLNILVTSRVVLHLRGEQQYPVPPLPLPDLAIAPSWQVIDQYPAVHLFVACARAVLPSFSLTADNAGSIGLICARLDGLPLAIELIAARVRLMSPAMLAARLTRRLALLNGQVQDRPMRQQTLSAAIAWSYDNLAPAEQRLFRWLSVFSGGADLPAIEAVCQAALAPDDVIDVIAALLDQSMVRCTVASEGDNRFGMLETISEYAREQLLGLDEAAAAEAAHARYYCQFVQTLQPQLRDSQLQVRALELIASELANLRSAMAWALANQPDLAIMTIEAACDFFDYRCYFSEACQWLERALSLTLSDLVRARLLNRLGGFNWKQGDYAEATIYHEHALAVQERLGDEREVSRSLQNLAIIAGKQGDYARSRELLERSLLIERSAGSERAIGAILNNLAIITQRQGDYHQAEVLLRESLGIKRRSGERGGIAISLKNLGSVILLQGRVQEAADLFCQSLGLRQEIGDRFGIASALEQLAGIAVQSDYAALAAQLLGAASHLREQIGSPVAPDEQADYAAVLEQVRAALDPATFESAWNAGVTQALEETTTAALTLRRIAPATVGGR